jgi:hypothetical protein
MYAIGYFGGWAIILGSLYYFFPNTVTAIVGFIFGLAVVCVTSAWKFLVMFATMLN